MENAAKAEKRLFSLETPSVAALEYAWMWVGVWAAEYEHRTGKPMRRPFIFANEEGDIEFEWEEGERWLCIRIAEMDAYDYGTTYHAIEDEREHEGACRMVTFPTYIEWVLDGKHPGTFEWMGQSPNPAPQTAPASPAV